LTPLQTMARTHTSASPAKAWLRALELTAPIARNRERLLSTVIEELAAQLGDAPALLSDRECLTYRQLSRRINQYARWALDQGLCKGEVVGLLMANQPEYIAIWLGITSVGGVVSLLNTNLVGPSLAHCIDAVSPKHLIVAAEFAEQLALTQPHLSAEPAIWMHGENQSSGHELGRRIDVDIEQKSGESLSRNERRPPTIEDRALYIYTSGTTG
jgi:fatty-acyl-CoA synthase